MKKILSLFIFLQCISCSSGSDLNKPENSFEGNFLPIGQAIYHNNKKEATELLNKNKISIDSVGEGGMSGKPTFLMYTVLLEKEEMVEVLLKLGANPNKKCLLTNQNKTNDSKTGVPIIYYEENPLNWSTFSINKIQTAKKISGLLIDHGADINGWGDYYDAPLKNAVMGYEGQNAKEMLQFLLSKGADINAYLDKSGNTILKSVSGEWQLIDYLLEEGADPEIIDFTGWNFMWEVEERLSTSSEKQRPPIEQLKNKLISKYDMKYPAVQNKEMGDMIRIKEKKKRGWVYDENGKFINAESKAIYNELRGSKPE